MAQQTINNGDSGLSARTKINSNFTELYTAPYLVYTALLIQTGTSAPVATVLTNTLGGTVVWTYDVEGGYIATLAGVFTAGKTWLLSSANEGWNTRLSLNYTDVNSLYLEYGDTLTGLPANEFTGSVEIRVYP